MFKSQVAFSPEGGLAIGEFGWDLKLIIDVSNKWILSAECINIFEHHIYYLLQFGI